MKILFKNKTKNSKEIYKKFIEFHSQKYGIKYILFTIFMLVFFMIYIILQFKYRHYKLAFSGIAIILGFILWRLFEPVNTIRKELNSEPIKKEKTYIFSFYEKYFIVNDLNTATKVYYFRLHKAFETKSFYYLYIDTSHAYIVDKSSFVIGTCEDFSIFLKKKLWIKFKIKNNFNKKS